MSPELPAILWSDVSSGALSVLDADTVGANQRVRSQRMIEFRFIWINGRYRSTHEIVARLRHAGGAAVVLPEM